MNVKGQSVKRGNTSRILTAVLQQKQRVIKPLVDRLMRKKTYNPTHLIASSVKNLKIVPSQWLYLRSLAMESGIIGIIQSITFSAKGIQTECLHI